MATFGSACALVARLPLNEASQSKFLLSTLSATRPPPLERQDSLRVFGCLPGAGARGCTEAGVRKASREETAGEFAPTLVSVYGDLGAVYAVIFRFSNTDDGWVITAALVLVAVCRIGRVVLS